MQLPNRNIRIAALGTLVTLGSTMLLVSGAAAAPDKVAKPASKPANSYQGHVHIDNGLGNNNHKQNSLYMSCAVRIGPHDYDPGQPAHTFTVTASGKNPTENAPITVALGKDSTDKVVSANQFQGFDPMVVHLDD